MRPAIVLAVSMLAVKDGKTRLLDHGYGMTDLERDVAATFATDYRLASVTKRFTTAALPLLTQEGKLGLDEFGLDDSTRHWLSALLALTNTVTLRELVTEKASCMSLQDFLKKRIFKPLHMDHTLLSVYDGNSMPNHA